MFKAFKKLFDESGEEHLPHFEARHLHAAVACLLHESKRVDMGEDVAEHRAALRASVSFSDRPKTKAKRCSRKAARKRSRLTSYYSPVSVIKRDFDLQQRIALIEHLWRIAYADGELERDEDHYVRKIAQLLHVSNTDAMVARSRAKAESAVR